MGDMARAPATVAIARTKWSVLWLKKGEVIWTDFGEDFSKAIDIYTKAVKANKKAATLRCNNVGFPPPAKITEAVAYKIVKRKGKRYKKKTVVNRMKELNAKGWIWCPYCVRMRQFIKTDGFEFEGIWVDRPAFECPMCEISSADSNVRKYNPLYTTLEFRKGRRSGSGNKKRSARNRR
jgi:hypothetical protein